MAGNKTLFTMKAELKAHGIKYQKDITPAELTKLFETLPITGGQIRELKLFDIDYSPKLHWTRGQARDFISEARDYMRLRGMLPASPKQRMQLMVAGIIVPKGLTSAEAAQMVYNLPATASQLHYIEKNKVRTEPGKKLTYGYCGQLIKRRERHIFEYKSQKDKSK